MAAKIYWLASYPRSGNTWLRVLLAQAIYGRIENSKDVVERVPSIHDAINGKHLMRRQAIVMKTHWPYRETMPFKGEAAGAIYIVRHPADVMASALRYRFMVKGHQVTSPTQDLLERTAREWVKVYLANRGAPRWIREGFGRWDRHAESWIDCRTMPVHLVRYEDLRDRTLECLTEICLFLNASVGKARLAGAVRNSTLERMHELEQREIKGPQRHLFRSSGKRRTGVPGLRFIASADSEEGRALVLTDGERNAVRAVFAATMAKFGYD
jgi:hypothetical protein